jgi:hypothetical protein
VSAHGRFSRGQEGIKGVCLRFRPEGSGDEVEKMTSTAMREKCTYEVGYVVSSYQDTNGAGKTIGMVQHERMALC